MNNIEYRFYEMKKMERLIEELSVRYDEEWRHVYIKDKKTTYICSNFSRIKNTKNDKILRPIRLPNGYYVVSLSINGVVIRDYVHRIIGKTFIEIPEKYSNIGLTFSDLEINHLKGWEKWNNTIFNLEWVTDSENKIHGYRTGLYNEGEKNHFSIYTEDQIRKVCQYIEDGNLKPSEISDKTKVSISMIHDIRCRISWKSISKDYDFSKYRPKNVKYSEESLRLMHKLLKDKKNTFLYISKVTNIPIKNIYYYNEKYYK